MEAGARSNLERITVPKFNGDKTKFERFWTAFSNCVDKGCESSEIKMLRLESCLLGKAADTLEGLDYSETACVTAKMRLQRKFGGPSAKSGRESSKYEAVACRQYGGFRNILRCFGEHCGFAANKRKTK